MTKQMRYPVIAYPEWGVNGSISRSFPTERVLQWETNLDDRELSRSSPGYPS
ncbi:MAG: hypothetical protein P8130_08365 [Deltaproteobacteria bacterium]